MEPRDDPKSTNSRDATHAMRPVGDGWGVQVNADALANAVQRIAELSRYAESMLSEIGSMLSNYTPPGPAKPPTHMPTRRHSAAGKQMMREGLPWLRVAAAGAHTNYAGAMSTNLAMWSYQMAPLTVDPAALDGAGAAVVSGAGSFRDGGFGVDLGVGGMYGYSRR